MLMDDTDRKPREEEWAADIRAGNEEAFVHLFDAYYRRLCAFATGVIGARGVSSSEHEASEVVHDVFVKIWERRERFEIRHSLKAYLYQATRNQALNYAESKKRREAHERTMEESKKPVRRTARTAEDELRLKELADAIWKAVDRLPERRRTAFVLHRQHDLTYREVAEVMGISKKTVEHQMGSALKALRESVSPDDF